MDAQTHTHTHSTHTRTAHTHHTHTRTHARTHAHTHTHTHTHTHFNNTPSQIDSHPHPLFQRIFKESRQWEQILSLSPKQVAEELTRHVRHLPIVISIQFGHLPIVISIQFVMLDCRQSLLSVHYLYMYLLCACCVQLFCACVLACVLAFTRTCQAK